jgi:hypothetical protein
MAQMKSKDHRMVWVRFHLLSGTVEKIWFREPTTKEMPKPGGRSIVIMASLSEWAIAHVNQLKVLNGKVVNTHGMGGL